MTKDDFERREKMKKLLKNIIKWKTPKTPNSAILNDENQDKIEVYCRKYLKLLRKLDKSVVIICFGELITKFQEFSEKTEDIISNFSVLQVAVQTIEFFVLNSEFELLRIILIDQIRLLIKLFELSQKKEKEKIRQYIISEMVQNFFIENLMKYVLSENIFTIKSSFGIYNYMEEALFLTFESLVISSIELMDNDEKKESLLLKIFEKDPIIIDYFPLNIFTFVLSKRKFIKNVEFVDKFVRLFMIYSLSTDGERVRVFLGFIKDSSQLLTQKESMESINKVFEIVLKMKIFDMNIVKVLVKLSNSLVHFSVQNIIEFINEKLNNFKIWNDLIKNIYEILAQVDFVALNGLEIDIDSTWNNLDAQQIIPISKLNKIKMIKFFCKNFISMNFKGKKLFLDSLLKFVSNLDPKKIDLRASTLTFIFKDIILSPDTSLKDKIIDFQENYLEILFTINIKFSCDLKTSLNRLMCKQFFDFFTVRKFRPLLASKFQKWFDFYICLLARETADFLMLIPYFYSNLFENPKLVSTSQQFFQMLSILIQYITNYSDFPIFWVENDSFISAEFNFHQLNTIGKLILETYENKTTEKIVFLSSEEIYEKKIENDYLFFTFLYMNKFQNCDLTEKFTDKIFKILETEFLKNDLSTLFFEVFDFFYFLSHFEEHTFFVNGFLNCVNLVLNNFRVYKYNSNPVYITKINFLLRQTLLHCFKFKITTNFFTKENSQFLMDNYKEEAKLFRNIFNLLVSNTSFMHKIEKNAENETENENAIKISQNSFIQIKKEKKEIVFNDLYAQAEFSLDFKYITTDLSKVDQIDSYLIGFFFSKDHQNNLITEDSKDISIDPYTKVLISHINSSEYKNIFKFGVLYIDKSSTNWSSAYEETNSLKSVKYQFFLNSLISETKTEEKSLSFESLFDLYKFSIGQFFNQSEIFEKRRYIGNSPIVIIFNEGHENPLQIEHLLTEFNVFAFVINTLPNDLYSIEIKNDFQEKIQIYNLSRLVFCENEVLQILLFLVLKYSKYVNEIVFQEQNYQNSTQMYFSNALLARKIIFEKLGNEKLVKEEFS